MASSESAAKWLFNEISRDFLFEGDFGSGNIFLHSIKQIIAVSRLVLFAFAK